MYLSVYSSCKIYLLIHLLLLLSILFLLVWTGPYNIISLIKPDFYNGCFFNIVCFTVLCVCVCGGGVCVLQFLNLFFKIQIIYIL